MLQSSFYHVGQLTKIHTMGTHRQETFIVRLGPIQWLATTPHVCQILKSLFSPKSIEGFGGANWLSLTFKN